MGTDWTANANCVAAWLMTEGSGSTIDDASANSNTVNFAAGGSAPSWSSNTPAAHVDYSINFTPNDYMSASNNSVFDFSDAFSIGFWVQSDGTEDSRLINRYDSTSTDGYRFDNTDGSGKYRFVIFVGGTTGIATANSAHATDGTWYHVYGTRNSSGTVTIYINGTAQTTTGSKSGAIGSTGNFNIATAFDASGSFFNGGLAEIGVFNDELNSTEINDIKDNGLKQSATTTVIPLRMLMGCGV